jgi:hypothetical protein
VIIFGSVFIKKKITKLKFFFLKKKTETKPGQTDRFRFGSVRFFRAKTGSNRFLLVFFGLARFWLGFFSGFLSVSVRFGFFGFSVIKPKPNRTGWFF